MQPLEELGRATVDGSLLQLRRRGDDYHLTLDGQELMSTRVHGSEVVLADLGCAAAKKKPGARVLVGGLGLGYTLRAALDQVGPQATVTVAEIVPEVVEWNREFLNDRQRGALTDSRTRIAQSDVWVPIGQGPWDAILMDTDNGPQAWCLDGNSRLYDRRGLERLRDNLAPGGILAIWCAQAEPLFVRHLQKAGFEARLEQARGHFGADKSGEKRGKGFRHAVLVAEKTERGGNRRRPRKPAPAKRRSRSRR
ncbi:MAG: hypothetical protein AAF690_03130 [Acidobacteriota bacterium]